MSKTADRVRVQLGARSYDVVVGDKTIERLGTYLRGSPSKRAFIIADERLEGPRRRLLSALGQAGWKATEIAVPAGESLKDLERLFPVYGKMLEAGIDRASTLFALGGGTVGDAAGFVASTYLRGIRWVVIPSTLLAQVDSAVGGKTAVNHTEGKNLIGTFHQPALVINDLSLLKTLAKREIISGLAEAVKYGLTFDPRFFDYLRKNWDAALGLDPFTLTDVVKTSVKWKSKVVAKDEFDQTGAREVLNFGHTFAHALEQVTGFTEFQHGEAVLWGMRFALALSAVKRKLAREQHLQADAFLQAISVPGLPAGIPPEKYFLAMNKDKKAKEGKVRFVLLEDLGKTVSDQRVLAPHLRAAFRFISGPPRHHRHHEEPK